MRTPAGDRGGASGETALEGLAALFVTDFPDVESKLEAWLPDVTLRFASTVREAYQVFDSTVGVVCVAGNLLDDRMESFRTDVLARRPFCQFVVVEARPLATERADDYDAVLVGPVSRPDLRATIRRRLQHATYSTLLQEYYVLNSRAVTLRHADEDDDEELRERIDDRLAQLRPQLRRLQAALPEADIREISNTVDHRRDYLNQPSNRHEGRRTSKYHPDACPECGVVWGPDHGNELERGFESLGAGVWKCRGCEAIVHELHDNQNITKW